MKPRNVIVGLATAAALAGGGVAARDVSTLDVAPIERVEIIAGERVEAKQIENTVEATFPWKDQPGIKVKYDMGEPTVEEKFSDVRKKQVITETVTDFEGGFKVDIILSERPDTNRFCYTIEGAENYDFFYQPPLTEEEIANGDVRPPEIEGSYAVYHKTLANHRIGSESYATGKVMHIPRPQVWEVDNQEKTTQWAELSYDEGTLCVTAPQEFLDSATYPVRIDPTFGYTTLGGTLSSNICSFSSDTSAMKGLSFTLSEAGTLDSIHVAVRLNVGSANQTPDTFVALYREDSAGAGSHDLVASVEEAAGTNTYTTTSGTFTFEAASEALTADTYIIAALCDGVDMGGTSIAQTLSDDTNDTNGYFESTTGAGAYATRKAENPWTESATANEDKRTYYVTYTASGGGSSSTPSTEINFFF